MSAIENIEPAARAAGIDLGAAPGLVAAPQARECLTFRLGHEEYGIDILKVQEIRSYEQPTRIASAPSFVKGVVDLRGVIVPIIDLRLKFGLDHAPYDGATVTVILNVAQRVIGAVVDSVSDVVELKQEQIKPAPEFNGAVDACFINGIASLSQAERLRMLILVDIEKLMSSADMGLVKQILQ